MGNKANQGKSAEEDVQEYLKDYSAKNAKFDWERRYDAHSAGGRFQRQTYDFAYFSPGRHGGIEVKEVKHDFRLPHGNFEKHQIGKLRVRQLAGGRVDVLVHFSTTDKWRVMPLEFFFTREGGSWDLRQYAEFATAKAALDSLGIFVC